MQINFISSNETSEGNLIVVFKNTNDCKHLLHSYSNTEVPVSFIDKELCEEIESNKNKPFVINLPHNDKLKKIIFAKLADNSTQNDTLTLQNLVSKAVKLSNSNTLHITSSHSSAMEACRMAQAVVLAKYSFDKYKTKSNSSSDNSDNSLSKLFIFTDEPEKATQLYDSVSAETDGIITARNLVSEPPNELNPENYANRISQLSDVGLSIKILSDNDLKKLGAFSMLSVSQGSQYGAKLVTLSWMGGSAEQKPVALIGKGVTFDTGGISLKPAAKMDEMKGDMGGSAAVVGAMQAIAMSKLPVNVIGCVGLVENMPSSTAMRPGDVVKSMSGKTIEIANTDAEGRLVLADLITYIQNEYSPSTIIDLATLTGACLVALGRLRAGLFCNDDDLSEQLYKAGELSGDKVWKMPIDKEYDELIDSKIADVRNIGKDGYGGAITAAKFVERFVDEKTAWAHLDIAGVAMASAPTALSPGWASGFGVRLLYEWIKNLK